MITSFRNSNSNGLLETKEAEGEDEVVDIMKPDTREELSNGREQRINLKSNRNFARNRFRAKYTQSRGCRLLVLYLGVLCY